MTGLAFHLQDDVEMVLQPLAHKRRVVHHIDPVRFKLLSRPDAGEHQHLRAVYCTSRQQDFTGRADGLVFQFHASSAFSFESDALDLLRSQDRQVLPRFDLIAQERPRR